jgi:hypothetical protein
MLAKLPGGVRGVLVHSPEVEPGVGEGGDDLVQPPDELGLRCVELRARGEVGPTAGFRRDRAGTYAICQFFGWD